jgi:hypothetical protein
MKYTQGIMAQGPERPPLGLDRKLGLLTGAALLGVVAGIYFASDRDQDDEIPQPQITAEDVLKKKAARAEACGVLVKKQETIRKGATDRHAILRRLAVLGKCTDPNAIEFDFGGACKAISEGIRQNQSKFWHPILNPFYIALYDELKCAQKEFGEGHKAVLDTLLKDLASTEAVKKYRLLDPSSLVDSKLCGDAKALVSSPVVKNNIRTIRNYIIEKAPTLGADSGLRKMFEAGRAAFQEANGRPATTEELNQKFETQLSLMTVLAAIPGLCLLPVDKIIEMYDPKLTPDMLSEKRRLVLPVVRELLTVLKDEEPKKAQEVSNAILHLAKSMSLRSRK